MQLQPLLTAELSTPEAAQLAATAKALRETEDAILHAALRAWFAAHPTAESKAASVRAYRASQG